MTTNLFQTSLRALLVAALTLTTLLIQHPTYVQAAALDAAAMQSCSKSGGLSTVGNDADAIRPIVEAFRTTTGELNQPHPVNHLEGRRQINWDAAPAAVSAPNAFPGDFFNTPTFPRARGIGFETDGTELQLSGDVDDGTPIEFDNVDPSYSSEFATYSAERLFAAIGSNVITATFYSPAAPDVPAVVNSFGVVFTDVDKANVTKMDFFDVDGNLIHSEDVQAGAQEKETLSFAGVQFTENCVASVVITTGDTGLGAGVVETVANGIDLVVMDDFIYSEPLPVTSCGLPSTIIEGIGDDAASLDGTVQAYKDALGVLNAPAPFNNLDGYRGINWDAAPAAVSAPNDFPGNFFNFTAFPRARGIEFTTDGTGFQLSGDVDDGTPVEFVNINPTYPNIFQPFSAERLFTAIDSNVVTANFFNPASVTSAAKVDGFGAVFTDVDLEAATSISYFDADGNLVYKQGVQTNAGDEGLSFAGVQFDSSCVASVEITSGNSPLGATINDDPDNATTPVDVVVMDDFIFGEPITETVCGTPEIVAGTGANSAELDATVESYRTLMGDLNPNEPSNFDSGRRQINWDAAPAAVSAPNEFPGDFFNFNSSPRARGIEFAPNTDVGTSLQLSGDVDDGTPVEFENINSGYPNTFGTFSPERLFTAVGTNAVDARFFNPATQVDTALTNGFGAVFTDVDLANVTALKYYDSDNRLVYAQAVPAVEDSQESLSFAGLKFDTACVARVRLVSGNTALSAEVGDAPTADPPVDVVAMDDFIFGEPVPTAIDLNARLNLISFDTDFDRTQRPEIGAPSGVITVTATFRNVSDDTLRDINYVVSDLGNGNVVLNSTNGVSGVGASFPLPPGSLGDDDLLVPDEEFNVDFVIGLNELRNFSLLVTAFGTIGETPQPDVGLGLDLGWNYQLDSNPVEVAGASSTSVFLPFLEQ